MLQKSKHLQTSQINLSILKAQKSSFFASNKYSSAKKTQINTYKNQMRLQTPPTLQSANPSRSTLQPQINQISRFFTCMRGAITYWKSIKLEMKMHKQEHIHKGISIMLGVEWSSSPLALPFIAHFQLGSNNQYGITLLPLQTNLIGLLQPYSF